MSGAMRNFFTLMRRRYSSYYHWLLIHDYPNSKLARKIRKYGQLRFFDINIQAISFIDFDINRLDHYLSDHVLLIPIYNISEKLSASQEEKTAKINLRQIIHANPGWFSVITDLSEDFEEFFATSPNLIYQLNAMIINKCKHAKCVNLQGVGSKSISINNISSLHWNNVNGFDPLSNSKGKFYNIMYGEVSTSQREITGKIDFTGSIIGSYKLSETLGLIVEPLELSIQNNKLINIQCSNQETQDVMNAFFQLQEGSRELTEIGIGTNLGVQLKGRNLSFEERHPGLHLGFGGADGSMHIDFIFADSQIHFDETLVFAKNRFFNSSTIFSVDQ